MTSARLLSVMRWPLCGAAFRVQFATSPEAFARIPRGLDSGEQVNSVTDVLVSGQVRGTRERPGLT